MDWNETSFFLRFVDNCMDRRDKPVKRVLQKFQVHVNENTCVLNLHESKLNLHECVLNLHVCELNRYAVLLGYNVTMYVELIRHA
jgi:hypothetical protein